MKKLLTTIAVVITIGGGAGVAAIMSHSTKKPATMPVSVTKPGVVSKQPSQSTSSVQPAETTEHVQPAAKAVTPRPQIVQVTKPAATVQPAPIVQQAPKTEPIVPAPVQPPACPTSTDQGAYFQRGQDQNGKPICAFAYYNACPTSEAVSATDPMCGKK